MLYHFSKKALTVIVCKKPLTIAVFPVYLLEKRSCKGESMVESQKNRSLYTFLSIISICILIGMIFIYSSSSVYALERIGSADYYLKKQLAGFILGLMGLMVLRFLPLEFIKKNHAVRILLYTFFDSAHFCPWFWSINSRLASLDIYCRLWVSAKRGA